MSEHTEHTREAWYSDRSVRERLDLNDPNYPSWYKAHKAPWVSLKSGGIFDFKERIGYLVVWCVKSPETAVFDAVAEALAGQTYTFRKILLLDESGSGEIRARAEAFAAGCPGVTLCSRASLEFPDADYTVILDGGGFPLPDALFEMTRHINAVFRLHGAPDILYSDEDLYDPRKKLHIAPVLKPDYSEVLARGSDYIGRSFAVRTELLRETWPGTSFLDEDPYVVLLSLLQKRTREVGHIRKVLFAAFRDSALEPGPNEEARLEAIGRSWKAAGVDAAVRTTGFPGTYLPVPAPHAERNVSVVVTGHFSDDEKAGAEALFRRDPHVREVLFTGAADAGAPSGSRMGDGPADAPSGENNPSCGPDVHAPSGENVCPPSADAAVRAASGPYVFLTDRVPEALSDGFFETLAFYLADPANGAAGPMLVADGRVVHAGYAFSEGKLFVPYRGVPAGAPGYRGRLALPGDTASCTAAGMLVRKDVYEEAGGFDTALEALRDVDFCLRIRELGYGAVFAPDAVMTLPAGDAGRVLPDGEAGALGRSLEKLVRRYRKRTLEDPWYPRSFSAEQGGYVLSPVRKPVLPSTLKDRLYLAVDKAAFTDAGIELTGWAVSISRTVRYAVTDREKRPVPFTFEAVSRPNVLDFALKDTVWDRDYGFRILVRDTAGGPYTVTVSDGRQEEHFTFSPDEKKLVWRYDVKNRVRNLVRSPGAVLSAVTEAPVSFVREAAAYLKPEADRYREWLKKHLPDEKTLEVQRRTTFTYRPKISLVVPAYRTPEKFLLEMVDSVTRQTYDNWELCIADGSAPDTSVRDAVHRLREKDPRIRYTFLPGNRGISGNTNAALAMARGDWIALMDHDDILAPSVLFEMVARMNEDPETDCIYTDEDKITMDLSRCFYPSLKPEFDVDYLRSGNYICHFFAVKKELADRVGLFDPQCDGAQDLDYALRATECARKVAHLPRVLYHWRSHPDSTAADSRSKMYCYEAGKRAVNKHCERTGLPAKAFISPNFGRYHLFFDPPEEEPLISVVIWGDGGEAAAARTKASILAVSGYRHYEFLYGETAAEAASRAAGAYLYFIQAGSVVRPFELESVEGEYISDELVRRAAFPYNMLGALRDPACGFAAGKVVDAENSVCYGGILKNPLHAADYVFYGMQNGNTGYNGMLVDRHRVIAGSLMNLMMRRADYERAGGLSPRFASCFGEVDLCYRLDEAGYYGVFDPMVTTELPTVRHPHMPHRRFKKEAALAAKIHAAFLAEPDPWSTPHMGCFLREYVLR